MALRIFDDVLAPKGAIVYEYYGKNPFAIYPGLGRKMQEAFHARGLHIFEDDFRWDLTDDPRPFFFIIRMARGMDRFSEATICVKAYGMQPTDPTKTGRLVIEIYGWIETNFFSGYPPRPLSALQKIFLEPFAWIYHHAIYYKVRRQYIHFLQEGIEQLEAYLRGVLGMEMRERLTPYATELV